MFNKNSKFKFFYSRLLSIVEDEVNSFVETLPEGYQISYVKYYPPKYDGALHVVYIVYEPMICYDWNSLKNLNYIGIKTVDEEKD
jgi:hypothetical protein